MAKEIAKPTPYMSMGSDLLDLLVGGAKGVMGLPYGAILNIAGDKSSGKSFIKNEILAANYHKNNGDPKKFAWFSDDCESGDTFNTGFLYNVDLRPMDAEGKLPIGKKRVYDSTTVEEMDAHVSLFLEHLDSLQDDAVGIYAIDSLDGLSDATREAMEGARLGQLKTGNEVKDKGDFGMQIPKFLSQQFFRPKHQKLEDARCSLIIVSQSRTKVDVVGGYGQKWDIANGKSLEFYCHTRVFLTTVRKIEKDGLVIGAYVKATTFKSKTPRPYRTVYYTVYFNYGIDNIGSNLDYLFNLREKDGKLKECANAIKWEEGADLSLQSMKDWMNEVGCTAECRAERKAKEGNQNISMDWAKGWIAQRPELLAKFEERFGKQYTREELINMCEANPEMAQELTRRVIAKWEALEDSVLLNRPGKYGPRPAMPVQPAPAAAPAPVVEADPEPPADAEPEKPADEEPLLA